MESFFTPVTIQPKLEFGDPNDKYEQQADLVADHVIQRKCEECEKEESLQKKENLSSESTIGAGVKIGRQLQSKKGSGSRLPGNVQSEMTHKMGADFSNVSVHTDSKAVQLNRSLGARAFTHGSDIYFNSGEYNPSSQDGKHLLAHELTHVLQQGHSQNLIQKDEDEEAEGEPGTTQFDEQVVGEPQESRPHVWEGDVERTEFIPATDEEPRQIVHQSRVGLVYDENECEIRIPFGVRFEHPSTGNWSTCEGIQEGDPRPVPDPMPDTEFNELKERYIQQLNEKLNGWYAVRVENCENQCAGQNIDINVVAREDNSNPDATVVLTDLEGRSCVSGDRVTLYAGGGISDYTLAHEGGHMILGHGDEYRETDPDLDRPIERVRMYDWSLMASHHVFGRWALLHRRHFDFAREFVQQVRPACDVRLVELARPLRIFLQLSASLGGAYYAGGMGAYYRLGVDLGIPLDRMREWQLLLGAHGQMMMRLEGDELAAFMAGLRVGLERNFDTSTGGLRTGIFGEFGYGTFQSDDEESFYPGEQQGFYSEAGVTIGGSWAPQSGLIPFLEAEVAGGTTLFNFDLDNPDNVQWFRAGIRGGFNF